MGNPVALQTTPCSRSLQQRVAMPPCPSTQLLMPISAWCEPARLRRYLGTWKSPAAQAQHSQASERLGGHRWACRPSPQADCHRAGPALFQVDFILQNSCAKVWAPLVQGVLEGIPSMDKVGSGGGTMHLLQLWAGMGHCHPPASQGTGLARGGSRGAALACSPGHGAAVPPGREDFEPYALSWVRERSSSSWASRMGQASCGFPPGPQPWSRMQPVQRAAASACT